MDAPSASIYGWELSFYADSLFIYMMTLVKTPTWLEYIP